MRGNFRERRRKRWSTIQCLHGAKVKADRGLPGLTLLSNSSLCIQRCNEYVALLELFPRSLIVLFGTLFVPGNGNEQNNEGREGEERTEEEVQSAGIPIRSSFR